MSNTVELSDELIAEAREMAVAAQRSVAKQVEFWAQLGRSLEPLIRGDLKEEAQKSQTPDLSKSIADVGTDSGRNKLREHLANLPFPHYEPVPDRVGFFCRIEEDGTRSIGTFKNRTFIVE